MYTDDTIPYKQTHFQKMSSEVLHQTFKTFNLLYESESESEYLIYLQEEIVSLHVLLVSIKVKKQKGVCTDVVEVM